MTHDPLRDPALSAPTENTEAAAASVSRVPPDILAWARSQVNIEEVLAGLREIEQNGGFELRDFIHELEEAARRE